MTKLAAAVAGLSLISLSACAGGPYGYGQPYYGGKQVGGTLLGAAAGGLLGSTIGKGQGKLAATAGGALLGAVLGNNVGRSLDNADRAYAQRAAMRSFDSGRSNEPIAWNNPQSGNYGSVRAGPTYSAGGEYCREYEQTIVVGGRAERGYGTACQQPDGSWRIGG